MLKLIKCEFLKLKRKKFIPLIILAAFLFPIPLTYLMTTPSMMERYTDRADAFDGLFNMVLGYGIQFLLPCIIGVIAAILFFMERDNDTFKNLRTIPVTSTQMVLAKIIVLFIFGIVFCVASTIATILCGIGTLEVYGIGYKLFLAVETGIFITAGTLPLIVLVVFFSKTYVFSILLCVFYSVLNMSATSCDSLENGVILLYNKVRSKVNSELDLLLDEGDVDAILMGKKTQYPDAAIRLTEQMTQEFINDLFSTLRERMLDLQYCKVVFVGGGAILLKRQIETSGKVGTPFFVPKINANADGYEYLYRIETAGR